MQSERVFNFGWGESGLCSSVVTSSAIDGSYDVSEVRGVQLISAVIHGQRDCDVGVSREYKIGVRTVRRPTWMTAITGSCGSVCL